MKNRSLAASVVLSALLVLGSAAAEAGNGSNFVSGNKNNDGKYTPRKVRTLAKDPNQAPGFWDKEWKRSGLDQFGGAWNPAHDMKKFLKEKDEAYRARNAGSETR